MASAAAMGNAFEGAICAICLEYLTEPVTIDCGHNFCRACITQYSKQEPPSGTAILCPECQEPFQKGKFRPNKQLASIVENLRKLKLQPEKAKRNLCYIHQEKLKLFCEEDNEIICVICRESWVHRAHTVLPIEEAAGNYQGKLQKALGPLRKKLQEALALTSKEVKKAMEWQDKVENQRRLITREFNKLHTLLREEEQLLLLRLAEEEKETLHRLQDTIAKLLEQSTAVQKLITEIEGKYCQPAVELLQNVKSTLMRSENVTLKQPEAFSSALKNEYKICLDMREMLERFTANVTLDPDTAHPNLVLSEDRKSVRLTKKKQDLSNNPERFDTMPIVLGTEKFTGGQHYWEVEVGNKIYWILGVCRESVSRKRLIQALPENGYWAIWLSDGKYEAGTSPSTSLPLSVRPSQVGIFLDHEADEVSFYNVTDRSHLFTFTDTFSETLRPYFCPGVNSAGKNADPLIIYSVPAQAREDLCSLQ